MAILKTVNRLELIEKKPFTDEKEIQELTENNLQRFFRLILVKSEFRIGSYRFDTLAFDSEKRSFVIIEYKKGEDHKATDQASAYLSLMQEKINHRFIIKQYNKCKNEKLGIDDVDWSKSRVILISTAFSKYQREAANLEDSRIQLWEIKRSETMSYEKTQEPIEFDPTEKELSEVHPEQPETDEYRMLKFVMMSIVNRHYDHLTLAELLRQGWFNERGEFVDRPLRSGENDFMFRSRREAQKYGLKLIDKGCTLLIAPSTAKMREVVAQDNLFSGEFRGYLIGLPGAKAKQNGKYFTFSAGGINVNGIAIPYKILEVIGFYEGLPKMVHLQ